MHPWTVLISSNGVGAGAKVINCSVSSRGVQQGGNSAAECPQADAQGCRELIERITTSAHFRKSARQRQLLAYLADRALESPHQNIHEQEIGVAVFGRLPGYDTSSDNIVRVNIYELRKRLQAYFTSEGRNESTLVEIPKGAYCAVFVQRSIEPVDLEPADSGAAQAIVPKAIAPKPWTRYVLPAISAVLAALCILLAVENAQLTRRHPAPTSSPALNQLWSRMFTEGRATDIVLADSNLSLLQDALQRPLAPTDYFGGDWFGRAGAALGAPERRILEILMTRRYTSLADVHLLQRVLLLGNIDPSRINVHFARDFSPEDLKTSNVLISGSKRSNPWVQFFEGDLNFRFDYDEATGLGVIVNKSPAPGEKKRYATTVDPPMIDSYGVVAFVPNLAATGNVLILEGAGMHATESAGELVTNGRMWEQVARAIGAKPNAPLPYFEVLIKTRVMGAAMRAPTILAVRTRPANR